MDPDPEAETSAFAKSNDEEGPCEIPQAPNNQIQENLQPQNAPNEVFVPLDDAGIELMQAIWNHHPQRENHHPLDHNQNPFSNGKEHQASVCSNHESASEFGKDDKGASNQENANTEPGTDSDWPEDTENESESK